MTSKNTIFISSNPSYEIIFLDVKRLKRKAKTHQKKFNSSLSEALDAVAVNNGFSNWSMLMRNQRKTPDALPINLCKIKFSEAPFAVSAKEFFSDCFDDISLVKKFIDFGGSLDEVDEDDETELIRQSRSGHPAMVLELLKFGANANYETKNLQSALREAAKNGKTQICKILIDHGVDVNGFSRSGDTALNSAAHAGFYKTCEMLLNNGSEMVYSARDGRRHSVLCTAAMRGRTSLFKLFTENGININCFDMVDGIGDWNALMWAVYHGDIAGVRSLIDFGSDVNFVCERTRETALMHAAQDGKAEIFDLLIVSGARTDLCNLKGESAFDKAENENSFRSYAYTIPWSKNSIVDDGRMKIRRSFDSHGGQPTFHVLNSSN